MATIKPNFTTDKINEYLKKYRNITFKSGVYKITKMMICPSNTVVHCEPGVIFERYCRYQMLEMEASPDVTGYNGTHDVTWDGGIFKANERPEDANVIVLYHCKNIILRNIVVDGCRGYHSIECNSSCGVHIEKCLFYNQSVIEGEEFREAIQIDFAYDLGYPYRGEYGNPASDGTHCKDITIDSCEFRNVPNGIGTHTVYEKAKYHENIYIRNCQFSSIKGNSIQLLSMKGVIIDHTTLAYATKIVLGKRNKGYTLNGKKVKMSSTRYNVDVTIGNVLVE